MHTVVERELELNLVLSPHHSVPVPALLSYRADDPYAVHVSFHVGSEEPVTWTFARELLIEGIFRADGHGDVRIWPTAAEGRPVICLALSSPDGSALLEAPTAPVSTWLHRTLTAVPPGTEPALLHLDEGLDALLSTAYRDESPDSNP